MSDDVPSLRTRVAKAQFGDNYFRGHLVNAELLPRETMSSMVARAVGGPHLEGEDLRVLDELSVAVTVADPRIWPLKLTRVVGAYGSMFAAYGAGNICLDGALMSVDVCKYTAARLYELASIAEGLSDEELTQHLESAWPERRPPGFGVPGRPEDERVSGLSGRMRADGRRARPYFLLFERVAASILESRKMHCNLTLIFAAIALDLGFEPAQIGALAWATAQNAFLANAVEAAQQAPKVLQELPVSAIRYVGPEPRVSARALKKDS